MTLRLVPMQGYQKNRCFLPLKAFPPVADEYAKDIASMKQWLSSCAGLAHFHCSAVYDASDNQVTISLRSRVPDGGNMYTGPLQIRIVEVGGTWHYMKRVEGRFHEWTFDLHSHPTKNARVHLSLQVCFQRKIRTRL